MRCPFVIQVCTKCKRILVANEINFTKSKGNKNGVVKQCKICRSEMQREKNQKNKNILLVKYHFDKIDINKVWNHCPFVIQVCTKCKKILVANETNFNYKEKGLNGLDAFCKECKKKYRDRRKDKAKEYAKQYYIDNEEAIKEKVNKWAKDNPEKVFNNVQKRRQKLKDQGVGVTKEQWLEMMNFFDWKCAYSGEKFSVEDERFKRTIDHIIPLNNNGLNEPWNCIPMTKGYNSSKNNKDMVEWYKQQDFFNIDRLMKIYEWQEYAFEKWGDK